MSDDDKRKLPVPIPPQLPEVRREVLVPGRSAPQGYVGAKISGFAARANAHAAREHEAWLRAQTGAATAGEALARQLGRLQDLGNILTDDQSARDAERAQAQHDRAQAARQRAREQATWELDDEIALARKQAELEQARNAAIYDERRRLAHEINAPHFIAGTGYKVQAEALARQNAYMAAVTAFERKMQERAQQGGEATAGPGIDEIIAQAEAQLAQAIADNDVTAIRLYAEQVETLRRLKGGQ